MARLALAALESALRARKLDRTLTNGLPPLERMDAAGSAQTQLPAVDACLGGGLPRGHVSEITGAASSGRTTLMIQLLTAATQRGELAALVDAVDRFDVSTSLEAGLQCDRFLWIRGEHATAVGPLAFDRHVDRALKAVHLVLHAGGFGLVVLDVADLPAPVLKRLPSSTWLRLQRVIEGSDTTCVLITPEPIARSAGGLTLRLTGRSTWAGASPRSRRLSGVEMCLHVVSSRRQHGRDVIVNAVASDGAFTL